MVGDNTNHRQDVNGKEIITTKQKLQTGKNKFTLDVAKLKAGFYFITINFVINNLIQDNLFFHNFY